MKDKIIKIAFFPILLIYLELIFRLALNTSYFTFAIINIILFSISYGLIISLSTMFLKNNLWKVAVAIITLFTWFIYISQVTFYLIYDSIYSFSLTSGAGAAFEFFSFLLTVVWKNFPYYTLYIFPIILLIYFLKKGINSTTFSASNIILLLCMILLLYTANLIILPREGINSAHELYYKTNSPNPTVRKLGLNTTMRLDFSRLLFGFSSSSELIIIDDNDDKDDVDNEQGDEKEDFDYNVMEIDFDKLIESEDNEKVKTLHSYFNGINPTKQNEMTGIFENKNLIMIVAESFDHIAIDKNITPTLYKLSSEGLNFTNFYTPIFISTIDGEYMTKMGLLPKEGVWSMWHSRGNALPFTLANQFSKIDYQTTAIHNGVATYYRRHESYPNIGYDNYYACGQGLDINCHFWPQSDLEMIEKSSDFYMDKDPFFTYFLTVSGHLRHNLYNQMAVKNWDEVRDLPYSSTIRSYMAQHIELDKALELLIEDLDNRGILSETVIALSSDHWPYGLTIEQLNERSSEDRGKPFNRDKLPFIIWNSEFDGYEVDLLGSSVDITPTLSNLFGLEYDSRLMMGKDIFSNEDPIVIFSDRSWITNEGKYLSGRNEFLKNYGYDIDDNYVNNINNRVHNYFQTSRMILENDYYSKIDK